MGNRVRRSRRQIWQTRKGYAPSEHVIETASGALVTFYGAPELTNNAPTVARESIVVRTTERIRRRNIAYTMRRLAETCSDIGIAARDFAEVDLCPVNNSYRAKIEVWCDDITPKQLERLQKHAPLPITIESRSCGRHVIGKVKTDSLMPIGRRIDYTARKGAPKRTTPIDRVELGHVDHSDAGFLGEVPPKVRDLAPHYAPDTE